MSANLAVKANFASAYRRAPSPRPSARHVETPVSRTAGSGDPRRTKSPRPSARHVETPVSRTAGSGDPRRTKPHAPRALQWTGQLLSLLSSSKSPNILKTLNTLFVSGFFFEKNVLSPIAFIRFYGGGCILVSWGYWLYALHANAIARIFVLIGTRIESGNRE